MSPPNIVIPKERVVATAFALVQEAGLSALTARALASRLGCSVGPIYRACESMERLTTEVLERARDLLRQYTGRRYSEMPFRNAGVGLVLFARDEPKLYLSLFVEKHHFRGVMEEFSREIEATLSDDATFDALAPAERRELLQEMWTYSHGLAMFVVTGMVPDASEEAINERVGRIGFAVITAAFGCKPEAAGVGVVCPRR